MPDTSRYLSRVPRSIPKGKILVHNFPPTYTDQMVGLNGWRIWLDDPKPADYKPKPCKCGWKPELGPHFTTLSDGKPKKFKPLPKDLRPPANSLRGQ